MRLIKIFVSGIRAEMRNERQILIRAFESLRAENARIDLRYSDEREPRAQIDNWIYECDVFVSLLDRIHFGSLDVATGHSFPEVEFDRATQLAKPLLVCVKQLMGADREHPDQHDFAEKVVRMQTTNKYVFEFDDMTWSHDQVADMLMMVLPEWLHLKFTRPLFQVSTRQENFIGRQPWIESIKASLSRGQIVMLNGIGGIGKTALAVEVAHQLREKYSEGVLWADVRTDRPADILAQWGHAYGGFLYYGSKDLRFEFRPLSPEERQLEELTVRAQETRKALQGKRILAILDGIHDERDNAALIHYLAALSNCAVIITSRTRQLRAAKEMQVLNLEPLNAEETWGLFARSVGENRLTNQRELVAEIGRSVDALPLALALTAAQLNMRRTMSLSALLALVRAEREKLEQTKWGYPHARGTQAALNTLFTLLSEDDQQFFITLSVFNGDDFDADAAATVADTMPHAAQRTLDHLAGIGLVQAKTFPKRYRLHAMVKSYARDKLEDPTVELRMAKHYTSLVRELAPQLHRQEMHHANSILTAELSNILATQRYAQARNDRTGWELCRDLIHGGMMYFFNLHQMWGDWISWAHIGIQACQKLKDDKSAVAIAGGLGMAYQRKGDWTQAIAFFQIALEMLGKFGNAQGMAAIYLNLGSVQTEMGDWEQAVVSLSRALSINERQGNLRGAAQARANIGMLYSKHNEKQKALAYWTQAMEIFHSVGAQNEMDIVRAWIKALPPEIRQ